METGFYLSEKDRELLRYLIDREVRGVHGPYQHSNPDEGLEYSSEIYLALTPLSGIPPLVYVGTGTTYPGGVYPTQGTGTGTGSSVGYLDSPGAADCTIFQAFLTNKFVAEMRPTALSQRVYNLSIYPVPGSTFVPVKRDKYGSWLTDNDASKIGIGAFPQLPNNLCFQSKACPTFTTIHQKHLGTGTGSGNVSVMTKLTVETLCIDPQTGKFYFTCADNPTNCCGGQAPPGCCNPLSSWPTCLVVTFGGLTDPSVGGNLPFIPFLNGRSYVLAIGQAGTLNPTYGLNPFLITSYDPGYSGPFVYTGITLGCAIYTGTFSLTLSFYDTPNDPLFLFVTEFFGDGKNPPDANKGKYGGSIACTPKFTFNLLQWTASNCTVFSNPHCPFTNWPNPLGGSVAVTTPDYCSAFDGTLLNDCENISSVGLGKATSGPGAPSTTLVLSGVTVAPGELLIVNVGIEFLTSTNPPDITVKFRGVPLTPDDSNTPTSSYNFYWVMAFHGVTSGTGNIVITLNNGQSGFIAANAVAVSGLQFNQLWSFTNQSQGNPPMVQNVVGNWECTYINAAFICNPQGAQGWDPYFTSGAQDVVFGSIGELLLTEGFLVDWNIGTYTAQLTNSVDLFAGIAVIYR